MSDPIELEDNFVLIVSDQGVAIPTAHAASHAAAGSDPLTLTLAQISNAGTMAAQNANNVAITGGAVAGVTLSSSSATLTGGTMSGVTITASSATLTGGTINGMAIGGSTPAAGAFTTGSFSGNVTVGGTLAVTGAVTLTVPLAVGQGGTGSTTQAGARAALGLGTIATQSAASVTLTGGTINGIVIGGVTPALGTFTTLGATNLTVTGTVAFSSPLPVAQGGTGATDAPGARTNLGLVIGTNVQAYDAELAAIAGLTSAANKGLYFTGSGAAATYDLSSYGRSVGGAADAAALRALLGMASGSATLSGGTVNIPDPLIQASSVIVASHHSASSPTGHLYINITPGVGFDISSTAGGDVNDVDYIVIY